MASVCINCGQHIEANWKVCPKCGVSVSQQPMCDGCGEQVQPGWIVCPACGKPTQEESLPGTPIAVSARILPKNVDDVEVSWQGSDNQGESPATEYVVRRVEDSSTMASADASSFIRIYCRACGSENVSDLQLCEECGAINPTTIHALDKEYRYTAIIHLSDIGQSFSFTVSAVNSSGESAPSSPSNAILFAQQQLLPSVERLLPGEICTIAGNGKSGNSGDGSLAIDASLNEPYDVAVDELGNVYVADSGNNKIRKISVDTGIIETEVGTGGAGFSGDGGHALNGKLDQPMGIDFDSLGNLYIADRGNHRVRKVDSESNELGTFAGNGKNLLQGDSPAYALEGAIGGLESVSVDRVLGSVFIAGQAPGDRRKKVFSVYESLLTTLAGAEEGEKPQDGGRADEVGFSKINDLVIESEHGRNVFIGEHQSNRLYMVSLATLSISTIAGTGSHIYKADQDNGPAIQANLSPQGLAFYDRDSTLFVNDGGAMSFGNKRIRKIDMNSGMIITVAGTGKKGFDGDGGPAINAKFNKPRGLAVDTYGNLYIADSGNNRIRVVRKP